MHRLKDLSEPQRLHQLGDGDFPPLRTLHATNLPTQATPLVGRERELAESTALLREHRLVTLTGPGGSGKTRLALQLAADTLEELPDGVFWVSLQAVRDPALVLPAIAQTLGVKGRLVDHVADNRVLLLLDNLEQVIESAPALSGLLADTRNTKLLVTSREPLRIRGEQRYPVEPLPDSDAIRLFLERARAVDPDFEVSAAVAEICRRLDRLPLALELAAARVSLLVTDDLLARLEQALPVLTLGARDAPERQRTLEATIAWSYDLLSEPEQRLFRRLGAFAGSFDRGAIEAVCEAQIDTLQSLVDKSLVRRWGSGRLGMLETVHEFAIDRLAASGEADAVRWNHAQHYLAVAKEAHLSFLTEGEEHYELAVAELDNFRAALDWALAQREFSLGAELAVSLANLWVARDPFEGERRFGALLEAAGDELSPELAAHLLFEYGSLLFLEGEYERGLERQERSLAAYRELGDERGIAEVLARLSVGTVVRGNFDRTRALGHEALEMNRRLGRRRGEAMALYGLAQVEWETGDFDSAVELMRESGRSQPSSASAGGKRARGMPSASGRSTAATSRTLSGMGARRSHALVGSASACTACTSSPSSPTLPRPLGEPSGRESSGARSRQRKRVAASGSGRKSARRTPSACWPTRTTTSSEGGPRDASSRSRARSHAPSPSYRSVVSGRPAARAAGPPSTSKCGIQSSQRGRYQFRSPRSVITAGTSTERTTVASMRSAIAMPKPICWNITSSPAAKPAKTATMIRAAPVMIRAVEPMPKRTASALSPHSR